MSASAAVAPIQVNGDTLLTLGNWGRLIFKRHHVNNGPNLTLDAAARCVHPLILYFAEKQVPISIQSSDDMDQFDPMLPKVVFHSSEFGGRMSTSRGPDHLKSTVDLGAQFISATPQTYKDHHSFYDELLSKGILQPLTEKLDGALGPADAKHHVIPTGISSIVKYYLNKSEANIKYKHLVRKIERQENKWTVNTEDGASSQFDCVVITIPVPQILQLSGSIRSIIDSKPEVKQKLEKVEYSSRFALGLYYKPGTEIDVPWRTKDFFNDPCLRLVSIDNRKRGISSTEVGPSVCIHTSVPFSLPLLEKDAEIVCKEHILPRVQQLVPQLPNPDSVKYHKWRYSQVFKSYEGQSGAVVLHDDPLLLLGGDAFTAASGFDMCIDSAIRLSEEVINYQQKLSNL